MSEINDNDMDIRIGIDDEGVDEGLASVEAKLSAFSRGVQSILSFEINDDAIRDAESSLKELTNISLDSVINELGELAAAMMRLNTPDLSDVGNLSALESAPIDEFTTSLVDLQGALLKTSSLYDLLDSQYVGSLSEGELTQAQNELTAYQAALDGVSTAIREQWAESESLGLSTEQLAQVQSTLRTSLETVEAKMSAVDDAMDHLAEAYGRLGSGSTSEMENSFEATGQAAAGAASQMGQAATTASSSMENLGSAMRRAFQYDSQEAMLRRKADLEQFIQECQQLIDQLRVQSNALNLADMSTAAYIDQIRNLQQSIAATKSAMRDYKEELAYIQGQLQQTSQAQQEYNNSAASGGGGGLPTTSTLSSPMSPGDMQWASGVREIGVQLQEACSNASTLRERMQATGSAVQEVVRQSIQGAQQTTLWQRIVTSMQREWASIGNMVKGIVFSQMFYQFTNAISSAINELKEFRYQLEETSTAYGIMLQDVEKGNRLTNSLMNLAADTQLSFTQVNAASRKLTAYGFEVQNLETVIRGVADASAAAGDAYAFDRIILALGQIHTKGKLAGQEINQLAEAGVNARKYLTEGLGITVEELAKVQKQGIASDVAIKLILDGMARDYGGAADKIADTMTGLSETIHDNFLIIGQGMLDPFFEAAKGIMTNVRDVMNEWRTIVVDHGFGALLETIFPKSFVDQIRLFIANLNLFRESLFKILQALGPFVQGLIHVGLVLANAVLPIINLFLTILANLINVISQNEGAMRLLTASFMGLMVAKAVSWVMSNFLSVVDVTTKAVTWLCGGLKFLGGLLVSGAGAMRTFSISTLFARLMAGDFTAAIAALIGVTTALVFSSEKASQAMTSMMGSLTKSLGHDFTKVYQPNMEESSAITDEFNQALGVSDESLEKLGDSAKDASKKAKNAVAAFDEVFTLTQPDDSSSDLDMDLSGLDYAVPDLDYSDFLTGMDDFQEEVDKKHKDFWDTWLGRSLKGIGSWIGESAKGFLSWFNETIAGFDAWFRESQIGFTNWINESISGFDDWFRESLAGFTTWAADSISGFDDWFRESQIGFTNWFNNTISGFDDWFRESLDGLSAWAGDSISGFDDWFRESQIGFTNWFNETISGFDDWFRESLDDFLTWAGDSIATFDNWFRESQEGFSSWATDSWGKFQEWISNSKEGFSTWASDTWSDFSTWIADSKEGFSSWATDTWTSFSGWISDSAGGFSTWATDTWDIFSGWISDSLGGIGQWTLDTFQHFSDWSNWTVEGITTWAADTWERFSTWISDSTEGFSSWAADTGEKFSTWFRDSKEGISVWATDTWDKFSTWISDSKEGFATWAIDTWASFTTWIEDSKEGLSNWASDTWASLTMWIDDSKEGLSNWALETSASFSTWVTESYDKISTWATDTCNKIITWATDTQTRFSTWATDSYTTVSNWASDSYAKFTSWSSDSYDKISTWASNSYNKFTTWASDTGQKLSTWADTSYTKLDNWSGDTSERFWDWADDTYKRFTTWASDTDTKFLNWVSTTYGYFDDWSNDTTDDIGKWANSTFGSFATWVTKVCNKIGEWDKKAGDAIGDWVADTVDAFKDWVSDTIRSVSNWGRDLWNSIISPLESVWKEAQKIFNNVGGLASSIWDSVSGKKLEKSISLFYDTPNIPGVAPSALGIAPEVPSLQLARVTAPLTKLSVPTAPNVEGALTSGNNKQSTQVSFAGIGKEIAEYLLPALANNNTGTQEQLQPLYVGTLIADDRGLRELERKMEVIRVKEGSRRGR